MSQVVADTRPHAGRRLRVLVAAAGLMLPILASRDLRGAEQPVTDAQHTSHENRLVHATSPYLLQHAHNPVDWYEWGPEALEKARRENKPIFLSIGYSACHWCHVMAHESFENEAIAKVMNRLFVNIKVDREERPDLDEIYMQATMLINNGQGGWPMSVWLTPDRKPFFAGTYFPPDERWGRPGFKQLCERIGELWETRRDAILADADKLTDAVQQTLQTRTVDAAFTTGIVDQVATLIAGAFDAERGGLPSGSNKFPPSMAMDLMLRVAVRGDVTADERVKLLDRVHLTLDRMAAGGIYDQLAGGICRYSTDGDWLVPHFEKMLYDQALVSRAYVDAWQQSRKPEYARVARDIFDYVLDDLTAPQGGFYSARDADSEGEEGRFYVWTRAQVIQALGEPDGALACDYWDVSEAGNWSDPHAPGVAKNILHVNRTIEDVANSHNLAVDDARQRLLKARKTLRAARDRRVPPQRDEKILCEWNGLMIASLARGGAVLNEPRYTQAAAKAADFILKHQLRDGRLLRAWRDGRATEVAFLADYAAMIDGLLELYEATFEPHWLDAATQLNAAVNEHYYDDANGGYFVTADDHEALIARSKDVRDSAVPSGNSVQLLNLLRLAVMTGDDALRARAQQSMEALAGSVLGNPGAGERFLSAVEFALVGPVEIALVGDPNDATTDAFRRVVYETYLPNRVVMLRRPDVKDEVVTSPLLKQRTLVDGNPAAYVCRNYACQRPVTDADALREQLAPEKN